MSIRLKLIVLFLAIALIPALFVGLLTFNNYKNSLVSNHISELRNIVAFKADKIETYFTGLKAGIELSEKSYAIKKDLPILNQFATQPDNPQFLAAKKLVDGPAKQTQQVFGLSDVMLVNPEGKIVYSSNPRHYSKDFLNFLPDTQQKAFQEGKNKVYFSDVFFNKTEDNKPGVLITAPVYDFNNCFIGVIAFEVDISPIHKLVQERAGLGNSGETLIGKKIGNQAVYLSPLKYKQEAALKKAILLGGRIGFPIQEAVQGKSGAGLTTDYRGKQVVAAWQHIPLLDWGLVAKIDSEEAFADVENLKKLVTLIMLIVLVLSGIMAFSISQSIAEPIKRLSKGVEMVGSGNLDYKVGTNLKDEIGQLSRAFDKMTQDLKTVTASRDELDKEIIERIHAEAVASRQREELQTILDSVPAMVFYKDKKNCFIRTNKAFENAMGMHKKELEGKCLDEIYPKEQAEAFWKDDLDVIKSGKAKRGIIEPMQTHTGTILAQTDKVPYVDELGNTVGIIGFSIDITELKKAEEALRESEKRMSRAQEMAHLGSWELDIVNNSLSWSDEVYRIFGLKPQEFGATYEAFLEAVHPDDRAAVDAAYSSSLREGRDTYEIDHRIIRKSDGEIRFVHEKCEHSRNESAKIIRSVGMVHDITERKKAEEVLKRDKETLKKLAEEQAQELLTAQTDLERAKRLSDIGMLAATVAHELRNPLASVKLAAFNIKRKANDPRLESHLNNIDIKVMESEQIINNLLFYSKIKVAHLRNINVCNILKASIDEVSKRFSLKSLSVRKNLEPIKELTFEADPLQIKEVFVNILHNAFDAIEENKKGRIEVTAVVDGNSAIISIKDNGEGIEQEYLDKVFDPFFTTKANGTGLGLAVCKQIMALHDGSVSLSSKKGKGTIVTITLPVERKGIF